MGFRARRLRASERRLRHTDPMTRGDWVFGLLTVVIPALIGAGSAMLTQRLSSRDSRANRRLQKRAELRDAVHQFLEAVQDAEAYADPASRGRGDRNTLLHRMWYRKRALEVVAPPELDTAAHSLTVTMRDVMFGKLPVGQDMWEYLDGPRRVHRPGRPQRATTPSRCAAARDRSPRVSKPRQRVSRCDDAVIRNHDTDQKSRFLRRGVIS